MDIITEEEAASIETKTIGGHAGHRRSKNAAFIDLVMSLQEGQSVVVRKSEWNGKSNPGTVLSSKAVHSQLGERRYHCFGLRDGSGWLVSPKKSKI